MQGIRQYHWGKVLPATLDARLGRFPEILAIWPAPINADACFVDAGFRDFPDSDEIWDQWEHDWQGFVGRVLGQLELFGEIHVKAEARIEDTDARSFSKKILDRMLSRPAPAPKPTPTLVEQIVTVTNDDRWGEVFVEFGAPAQACLLASRGHSILWLGWTARHDTAEVFVERLADGMPIVQTTLNWQVLLPIARKDVPV
jgi:hypothetical protein